MAITVKSVVRRGKCNLRCMMSDGLQAIVPRGAEGNSFGEEEFYMDNDVGYRRHSSLAPKKRPTFKVMKGVRDMSSFEPQEELKIIQASIVRNRDLFGGHISSEMKEELTHSVFLHLWERNYFAAYDQKRAGYFGFINTAVRRYLIDHVTSSTYRVDRSALSFQQDVGDDGSTLSDVVPDRRMSVLQVMEGRELLESLRALAQEFSDCHFTGHEETYIDIFDSVFVYRDFDFFIERSPVSVHQLRRSRRELVNYLAPFYHELVA